MLGRLTRYLRFVGLDTAYARGLTDHEVATWARTEGRFLLTRDRALAGQVEASLLLHSAALVDQWRAVRRRFPDLPTEVRFDRCTICNGVLTPHRPSGDRPLPAGTPEERVRAGLPLFKCQACGHLYWEGSHTADVRARLHAWTAGPIE